MSIPTIKFIYDRKKKSSPTTKGGIEMRITFNYKQKYLSTGVSCFPGQWDHVKECINERCADANELNSLLMKFRKKALQVISKMVEEDNIDIEAIPTLIKNKVTDITFDKYIRERMRKKQVTDYTKKAYHVFYSRLIRKTAALSTSFDTAAWRRI